MADATTARSDAASPDEELRLSDMDRICSLIGEADRYCQSAGRHQTRGFTGFAAIYDKSYSALCEGHLNLLRAVPDGSPRDLVTLAGHACMMADQIASLDVGGNVYMARMLEGIHAALISISGSVANRFPDQVDVIASHWPELGQSIRNDMSVARQMIAESEGR
ncbi:hypothetical protein [Sphingobium sp. WCS2017Hpa-17]|uniref:hypothetical protein n=1 Tax=Sphingobium sp. WCS2017Hpa-17 TaxID=3073638 RepID=UPI00288AD8D4|nr:hypothetical protein [Sphingobium sp. WCS2017Hpa-17]